MQTTLASFPTTETDPVSVQRWIEASFATTSLKRTSNVIGQHLFFWSIDQKDYRIVISGEGAGLYVTWKGEKPRLKDAITCFGPPEFYEAYTMPPIDIGSIFSFNIWYPRLHIDLSSSQLNSSLVVNDDTPFDTISVPGASSIRLMKLQPWPADTKTIHIDPYKP